MYTSYLISFGQMHFTTAFIVVAIPFLVSAAPKPGISIPINKRSSLKKSDGSVDIKALDEHRFATVA